jgi:hypothetical protein
MAEDRKEIDLEVFDVDAELESLAEMKSKLLTYFNGNLNKHSSQNPQGNSIQAARAVVEITREQRELLKLK